MPTVLRIEGFRFFFYSKEGNEPAHVHVERGEDRAKFWLSPVSLVWADGFNASEINKLLRIVRENAVFFLERWNEFFTHN
jgi:Domain of unknown function (DUF4160)